MKRALVLAVYLVLSGSIAAAQEISLQVVHLGHGYNRVRAGAPPPRWRARRRSIFRIRIHLLCRTRVIAFRRFLPLALHHQTNVNALANKLIKA